MVANHPNKTGQRRGKGRLSGRWSWSARLATGPTSVAGLVVGVGGASEADGEGEHDDDDDDDDDEHRPHVCRCTMHHAPWNAVAGSSLALGVDPLRHRRVLRPASSAGPPWQQPVNSSLCGRGCTKKRDGRGAASPCSTWPAQRIFSDRLSGRPVCLGSSSPCSASHGLHDQRISAPTTKGAHVAPRHRDSAPFRAPGPAWQQAGGPSVGFISFRPHAASAQRVQSGSGTEYGAAAGDGARPVQAVRTAVGTTVHQLVARVRRRHPPTPSAIRRHRARRGRRRASRAGPRTGRRRR